MQFATFRVGHDWLAMPALKVQEVVREQEITPIPRAPHAVGGLINLRGELVTVVDLREVLSEQGMEAGCEVNRYVVIREDGDLVALRVDRIGGVVDVVREKSRRSLDGLSGRLRQVAADLYEMPEGLVVELDPAVAVQMAWTRR